MADPTFHTIVQSTSAGHVFDGVAPETTPVVDATTGIKTYPVATTHAGRFDFTMATRSAASGVARDPLPTLPQPEMVAVSGNFGDATTVDFVLYDVNNAEKQRRSFSGGGTCATDATDHLGPLVAGDYVKVLAPGATLAQACRATRIPKVSA